MNDTLPSPLCPEMRLDEIVETMRVGDDSALRLLDEAREAWPKDPRLYFLSGATHAGAQQYDAARADFEMSLNLAPDFPIARFMLGFLDLTHGHVVRAADTWEALDALPPDDTLRVLKNGLLCLVDNQFDAAIVQLRAGIASNDTYPLINHYVAEVLQQLESMAHPPESDGAGTAQPDTRTATDPVSPSSRGQTWTLS